MSAREYVKVKVEGDGGISDSAAGKFTESEGDRLLTVEANAVSVKRRRGLCTLIIVVLAVGGAVGVGAYFLERAVNSSPPLKSPLQFKDVFGSSFAPTFFSASWMPASMRLVRLSSSGGTPATIVVYPVTEATSYGLEEIALCVLPEEVSNATVTSFTLSHDESFVLVAVNQSQVYRHSRLSQYAVVAIDPADANNCTLMGWLHDGAMLRYATIGRASMSLFYVVSGDSQIFMVPDAFFPDSAPVNISAKGIDGELFYGIPDWLYEEEIFSTDHSMWVSPDDNYVAFASIDETGVKSFEWTVFGDPTDSYVKQTSIRYPKAGSPNPTVKLHVASLTPPGGSTAVQLRVPAYLAEWDHYLMQVHWLSPTLVCGLWMGRLQQNMAYSVYDVSATDPTGDPVALATLTTPTWWENYPMSSTLAGDAILVKMPNRSLAGEFVHLALLNVTLGQEMHPVFLTSGDWEVVDILHVTSTSVVFSATIPSPHLRHVYMVSLEDRNRLDPMCITCTVEHSHSCGFNSFHFSPDMSYLLQQCRGPGIPQTMLAHVAPNGTYEVRSILESNEHVRNLTDTYYVPEPEFFNIEVDNHSMPAMRWRPGGKEKVKYPTLFHAYNGPLSQSVLAQYPLSSTGGRWHTQLVGQYGFQIIVVDGRGTGLRGDVYGKAQYGQLGKVETEDQMSAARYAVQHLKADGSKLAFWGWSYGGYMASMLGSSGTGLYAACVAVAPVTDWRYYDTAYTERFMRLPIESDNLANYTKTSVLDRVGMFNKTRFLLVHGTGDDNVHFQNTAQMVKALVEQDVDFRVQFYTDKAHALSGEHTQKHLYRTMSEFIRTSLGV